jgi:predicted CXXCH cytochrome family protein
LSDIEPASEPADGSFLHAATGRSYSVYRKSGQFRHREAALDEQGQVYAAADYPIRYLVGSGHHSRSYLVEADGFLLESPITWYASRRGWDVSPGYERTHWGFERAVDDSCLFCHVGRVVASDHRDQRLTIAEQPIGCERCHGPGSLHVAQQRSPSAVSKSKETVPERTIVHPRRLSRSLREAICSQCHLNIDAAITVRGRSLNDFRPGLPFSDFCINYQLDEPDQKMKVVGHVGQLHLSRCYQQSEKLTCTSCHDPHSALGPEEKHARSLNVCMSCHSDESCRLGSRERLRRNPTNDCVACHMPRVGTDIPHIAFTHHRIGVHEAKAGGQPAESPDRLANLVPFDDVSRFSEIDRDRNLGLAYFEVSQRQSSPQAVEFYQNQARQLLDSVGARGLRDGEAMAVLARLYRHGDPDKSAGLAGEALAAQDLSAKARVNCLCLAAEVGLQRNELSAARDALEKLVGERRWSQDWLFLAECRRRSGDTRGALAAVQQAVAIAPLRPELRNALAQMEEQLGDTAAAEEQRSIAKRLANQPRPNR